MKKIKVIDLLNMIANKEYDKLPEIISFNFQKYYLESQTLKANGVEVAKICTYKNDRCQDILGNINYVGSLCDEIIIFGQPILDGKEKEYLSYVIRPFRDKVNFIRKKELINNSYIEIYMMNGENIVFPYFKNGTMYKSMKTEEEYTLEELGL